MRQNEAILERLERVIETLQENNQKMGQMLAVHDEKLDKQLVELIEAAAEKESLALSASSMVTDDGIIDPRDTRNVLGFCLSVVDNNEVKGAKGYGVFRL